MCRRFARLWVGQRRIRHRPARHLPRPGRPSVVPFRRAGTIRGQRRAELLLELQKFLIMALKANPNILECLYSPMVEKVTPLGEELLTLRERFLSQMIFQTFNGYAMSQFKKIEQDIRNHGEVRWKHAMHLLRLLLTGAATLRTGS